MTVATTARRSNSHLAEFTARGGVERSPSLVASSVLGWAAFSFGAVYTWGHLPVAAVVLVFAAVFVRLERVSPPREVWVAFLLVISAVGLQLLPLSPDLLASVGPRNAEAASLLDVRLANVGGVLHGLSVDPGATIRGAAFLVVAAIWAATCLSILRRRNTVGDLAGHIAAIGALLAIVGLAQKAMFNGKLLWFWQPLFSAGSSFGPFVNRNHFAGWMLLAVPLASGLLFGTLSGRERPTVGGLRRRLLQLDSKASAALTLVALAAAVMLCSLVWTMSRSGIAAAGVALTVMGSAAAIRLRRTTRRFVVVGYVLAAAVGAVAWRGADNLVDWYGNTSTLEWRFALWRDTLPALRDFWLTGSGFNTYGTVMILYPRTDNSVFPYEAHNDYLQLAVEGGLLVGVPVLLLIYAVAREAIRKLRQPQDDTTWWIRMGAVAGICGMAVQEITEFSLQIPGVALLFATCVAIAIHEPAPVDAPAPRRRRTTQQELVTSI